MSKASRFARGVRFVPAAAPAGRALLKRPPAYTVLPTTAWDQTTPSICTVGSRSAVTVVAGGWMMGAGAACAGAAPASTSPPELISTARLDPTRVEARLNVSRTIAVPW